MFGLALLAMLGLTFALSGLGSSSDEEEADPETPEPEDPSVAGETITLSDGDVITTGDGNDTVFGDNVGDVTLATRGGDDTITGVIFDSSIDAGAGDDFVDVPGVTDIIGGDGDDTIRGFGDLIGGNGDDSLSGGGYFAVTDGGPGNDTIAFGGVGTVLGGDGNDVLSNVNLAPTEVSSFFGGEGDDTLNVNLSTNNGTPDYSAPNNFSGGAGNDVFNIDIQSSEVYRPEILEIGESIHIGRLVTIGDFNPAEDVIVVETELTAGAGSELLRWSLNETSDGHTDIELFYADENPETDEKTGFIRLLNVTGLTAADIQVVDRTPEVVAA